MHVIHIFDKYINSGVHSSARSIYLALKLVRPEWSQSAVVFSPDNSADRKCPDWFFLPNTPNGFGALKNILSMEKESVVILHRAMQTPVRKMVGHINCRGIPVIVVSHTLNPNLSMNDFGVVQRVVGVSDAMSSILKKASSKADVRTIRNFCEDTDIRWKFNDSEKLIFGRVNAFNKIKHSNKFIKWFCHAEFAKPAEITYIGDGSAKESAIKTYENHKSRNEITFTGWMEGRDVILDMMSKWHAMLYHINENEGTSMAVIDALCIGLPVFVSDLPGNNEIIKDGESGYVFSDLSQAEKIIEQFCNKESLELLSKNARKVWEENHSQSVGGQQYASLIEECSSLVRTNPRLYVSRTARIGMQPQYIQPPFLKRCESFLATNKFYASADIKQGCDQEVCLLITCKNKSNTLADALASVCFQSHKKISVSFVDDLSSDNSVHLWHKWKPRLNKLGIETFEFISNRQLGYAGALKKCLEMSPVSSIVAILDADDAIPHKCCSILASEYIRNSSVGFMWSQFVQCSPRLHPSRLGFSSAPLPNLSLLDSELSPNKKHCYSHMRSFKRFDDDHLVFDTNFTSSIDKFMGYRLEELQKGKFLNIPLYLYREPGRGTMTAAGGQLQNWKNIRKEAEQRRKINHVSTKGFV